MNEEEKGVDVSGAADRSSRSWLHGFWKEENNGLQPVPEYLREGVRSRATRYLDILAKTKWLVIEEWDQWLFEAERL